MSIFDNDPSGVENNDKGPGSNVPLFIFFAILFLPATIMSFGFYSLLRYGRLRTAVIALIIGVYEVILYFVLGITNPISSFARAISDFQNHWPDIIPSVLVINGMLAGIIGMLLVFWAVRQMKTSPHRRFNPGHWNYGFIYRRTPWEDFALAKKIKGLKNGDYLTEDSAPLGISDNWNTAKLKHTDEIVSRYYSEALTHTLVSGAAGSGKTITLLSLIKADVQNLVPTVIVDFKRSPELAAKVAKWAHDTDIPFYHFVTGEVKDYDVKDSPGQSFFDPLVAGSPTAKADMILGMREYDTASAVYKSNMQQLLQVLAQMLHYADRSKAPSIAWSAGGVHQFYTAAKPGNFTELAIACEGTPIQEQAEEIATLLKSRVQGTGLNHAINELYGQMRMLAATDYGQWMKTEDGGRNIDIFQLTKKPGVILFSLNSDSEPESAKYIGSLIMAELTAVSAKRRNDGIKGQMNVYVDEFQVLPPTSVTSLLEKARESKMAMTLAQQSFEQISSAASRAGLGGGESYLLSVLDTCSNFIIHSGSTEKSAERLSEIIGHEFVTTYAQSNEDRSWLFSLNLSNRKNSNIRTSQEERWVFEPRKFMALSMPNENNGFRSTAVMINKAPADPIYKTHQGALARTVWMVPDDEVLASIYKPKFVDSTVHEDLVVSPLTNSAPKIIPEHLLEADETIENYVEDEDGGFGWDKIPIVNPSEVSNPESMEYGFKDLRSTSSFSKIMDDKKIASPRPTKNSEIKIKNRVPEPKKPFNPNDDLPDLDF